jgi:hypothetical protein
MERKRFEVQQVSGMSVADDDLLADLRAVAAAVGTNKISRAVYGRLGKYSKETPRKRFGSWNKALRAAGVEVSHERNLSHERLFENILSLWTHYGRQPRLEELALAPSAVSESPYRRSFGSWAAALQAFVDFANATGVPEVIEPTSSAQGAKRGPRDPSLRLRFKVLVRDRFACQGCGASPATTVGVELHIDHILPWSASGQTTLENLRTLCRKCNLGKGALVESTG